MLEDELLEIEKGPFMVHSLSDLYDCSPRVIRESRGAVVTLLIPYNKRHHHGLL